MIKDYFILSIQSHAGNHQTVVLILIIMILMILMMMMIIIINNGHLLNLNYHHFIIRLV